MSDTEPCDLRDLAADGASSTGSEAASDDLHDLAADGASSTGSSGYSD